MASQHSTDAEETPTAETLHEALDGPIDTKLHLIQHHAKMARLLAEELLEEEVENLAGKRYSRKEEGNPLRRWGSNSGSIRIDGEKVPIDVPRVRDTDAEEDDRYGRNNRGDELPEELGCRKKRLQTIQKAKADLEKEAKQAGQCSGGALG